jgi:hypothetical protein
MQTESSETATITKIIWRLSPFLGLAYFIAYVDRSSVSFASLTMVGWITDTTGSFSVALYLLGIAAFIMGLLTFLLRRFLIAAELPDNHELVASLAQKV